MRTFYFTLDTKEQVWRRTRCLVDADSFEEALEFVKSGDYDCIDSEFLYETEEIMDPEDNGNESTIEIFDETITTCLYHN